jgi:hypothetical protein
VTTVLIEKLAVPGATSASPTARSLMSGSQIAFHQYRGYLQRRRNIVETEIAAIARQRFRNVEIHAQQIAPALAYSLRLSRCRT